MLVGVRMNDVLYNQLKGQAEKEDRNISDMVRRCIKVYIQQENKKEGLNNEK